MLKEKCQEINHVHEYCKQSDLDTSSKCLEILHELCTLIDGAESSLDDNRTRNYAACYLANDILLTTNLVQIIADSDDIRICSRASEILYILLTNHYAHFEESVKAFKKNLSTSLNIAQLLESMYTTILRFSATNRRNILSEMQARLLIILSVIYEPKRCRDLYLSASVNTVQVLVTLLSEIPSNKNKCCSSILHLLNIFCQKRSNCELFATLEFFESLGNAFKLTRKILTIVSILKIMSRNEKALHYMAFSDTIFKILLDLLKYSGKKKLSKRSIISILYRITKSEQGAEILKRQDNYQCLFEWLTKSKKSTHFQNKMAALKVYTILNRTITKIVLNPKPAVDLCSKMNTSEVGSSSEESDGGDESDEDSQDFYLSDAEVQSDVCHHLVSNSLHYLPGMQSYFDEIFNSNGAPGLKIFENVEKSSWKSVIAKRTNRYSFNDKLSYPDSDVVPDIYPVKFQYCVDSDINELDLERLAYKFKCAKGIQLNKFTPRIVYDFYRDCRQDVASFTLVFDSHFECGNLNTVIQTDEFEYELILTPDTACYRGFQWFYFEIRNTRSGIRYNFNIVNFVKVNSQYNYGMQPLLFSVTDFMLNGTGWNRVGENISYFGNNYTNHNGTRQYRTLSFSVSFKYSNDCVYFAYHYPYTYTRLMTILYPIHNNTLNNIYKRIDRLCTTINNNEVPILTITAAANKSLGIPITKRPIIFVTARVHPGETNSSWIAEGMIRFLTNETNEEAIKIREYFDFKIIPMLNIEGVICGNTRCGISGSDLNRCWANPQQSSCPEIYYTKKLVEYVKKGLKQDIAACIDIHGHSRKKFFFFYGCNPRMSWNQEDRQGFDCLEALKVLPRMIAKLNPHIRLNLCKYKIDRNRESTARVVMWREFGIQNSYTLECSYCSGDNKQAMDTKILTDIGANVIEALGMMHEEYLK